MHVWLLLAVVAAWAGGVVVALALCRAAARGDTVRPPARPPEQEG